MRDTDHTLHEPDCSRSDVCENLENGSISPAPRKFDSLGEAYDRANRRDDARKACSRAVERDPGNAHARAMLQELESR